MGRENIGVYYPEGKEHELEEFDEVAYRHQVGRGYSRSQAVREAMEMQKSILETLERIETPEEMSKGMREVLVEEAILRLGQPDE